MRKSLIFSYISKVDGTMDAFSHMLEADARADDSKRIHLACATKDGVAAGVLSYVENFTECEIKWIYVEEDFRRQGIGTALIEELIDNHLDAYGFKDIFFQINTFNQPDTAYEYPIEEFSDNPSLELFADRCIYFDGSKLADRYRILAKEWRENDTLKELSKTGSRMIVQKLFDNSRGFVLDTLDFLEKNEGYVINDYDEWDRTCEKDLSFVVLDDKRHILGLSVFHKNNDEELELSYLYAPSKLALKEILTESYIKMIEKYPKADIVILSQNIKVDNLVYRLFGCKEADYSVSEYHWNYTHPLYLSERRPPLL